MLFVCFINAKIKTQETITCILFILMFTLFEHYDRCFKFTWKSYYFIEEC